MVMNIHKKKVLTIIGTLKSLMTLLIGNNADMKLQRLQCKDFVQIQVRE